MITEGGGNPMARDNFDDWIPEEYDSDVIQAVNAASAVEALANRVPMKTGSKSVPRDGGVDVDFIAKGGAYNEDDSTNDEVILTAKKLGKAIRIAEEDIDDQKGLRDVIAVKQKSWATSYGKGLDNACLGVSAAVGAGVPFTSVYKNLSTTDADLGYTANDNIVQTGGDVTYDDLSDVLGLVEEGDYFDLGNMACIAHPGYRGVLRGIKDTQGMPIFIQGLAGTPDTLFGVNVKWSLGCKTNATASSKPTGNQLLVFVNKNYLLLGVRSGPESMFADGNTGLGMLTDEALLKMRARRGFALGHPNAAAVLEKTTASS